MKLVALIAMVGASAGCVSLRATSTRYAPGDRVHVVFANHSLRKIGFGICVNRSGGKIDLELQERLSDGQWRRAAVGNGSPICVDLFGELRFGRIESDVPLDAALPDGSYRFAATDVVRGRGRLQLATAPFVVGR